MKRTDKQDAPPPGRRTAFDGSIRRRLYVFRHGDVSYVDDRGNRVADGTVVPLTEWGREQAHLMNEFLGDVPIDKAICSGYPRTVETAEGILAGRGIEIGVDEAFQEIRSDPNAVREIKTEDDLYEIAYAFRNAHLPGEANRGGEPFEDFEARVLQGLERVLADHSWQSLALIAHGGVNRVILGWASGAGLKGFQAFEQNTCCVNIVDVDTHPETGEVVRRLIRGVNITPYDPVKRDVHHTSLEIIAGRMRKAFEQEV